jgi:uncharacterized protein YjbI with pentapeptide repeats
MADDPRWLAILKNGGVAGWNKRRAHSENLRPNLRGADLRDADLRCANLGGADLSWANLSRADLSGTDLSGADLRGANLCGADLRDADLSGADLRGTSGLTQGHIDGAWQDRKTTLPNGFFRRASKSPDS